MLVVRVSSLLLSDCWEKHCNSEFVGDGVCDLECNNPYCNFDSSASDKNSYLERFLVSDCYAECEATGCGIHKLGNEECDLDCNNFECGFDLADCGYCAEGCMVHMLGNGVCDPECNTKSCRYDHNDCGWCAEGCFKEDLNSSTCKPECNNQDCEFQLYRCSSDPCFSRGCTLEMRNSGVCYPECNNSECNYAEEACFCGPNCSFEKLSNSVCDQECNSVGCDFDNGYCRECSPGCLEKNLGDSVCQGNCNNPNCMYDKGDCSLPSKVCVGAVHDLQCNVTFETLTQALFCIQNNYTEVILSGVNTLEAVSEGVDCTQTIGGVVETTPPVSNKYSPLEGKNLLVLKIKGPAEVTFNKNVMLYNSAKVLVMENLVLSGNQTVFTKGQWTEGNFTETTCSDEKCYYCPSIVHIGSKYLDDRGKDITNTVSNYGYFCFPDYKEHFSPPSFYAMKDGPFKETLLTNVTFRNFRQKLKALVEVQGTLVMQNVTFSRVQTQTAAVEVKEGASLEYTGGLVEHLNDGFEYEEELEAGGFLVGSDLRDITLSKVNFTFNVVSSSELIYIKNSRGTITIENCNFSFNILNSLLTVDSESLVYRNTTIVSGIAQDYQKQHMKLTNCTFSNIYSTEVLIKHSMLSFVQNVKFKNLVVKDSALGGVISLENKGTLTFLETSGGQIYTRRIGNSPQYVYFPPRSITLQSILLERVFHSGFLLNLESLPNLTLEKVSILNSGNATPLAVYNSVTKHFIENPNHYVQKNITNPKELFCVSAVLVKNSFNLNIESVAISNILCANATSNLDAPSMALNIIAPKGNTTLANLNIFNISGASQAGLVLKVQSSFGNLVLRNIFLNNLFNSVDGILGIYIANSLVVTNLTASFCRGNIKGVMTTIGIQEVRIDNYNCNMCTSLSGNGAALISKPGILGTSASLLHFTNSKFTECSCLNGRGGVLMLISESSNILVDLLITNLECNKVSALEGSCIFFNENLSFSRSQITQLAIKEAHSSIGAPLDDYHFKGTLSISGMEVYNSTGKYCGLLGQYKDSGTKLTVSNFKGEGCRCSESLFSVSSMISNVEVYFENLELTRSSQAFELENCQFTGKHLLFVGNSKTVLEATKNTTLLVQNATFELTKSSVIDLSQGTYLECFSCFFSNNEGYSVVSVEKESYFNIDSSNFQGNKALGSGVRYSLGSQKSYLSNSVFRNNYSYGGGVLEVINSELEILNSKFEANKADSETPGVISSSSNLTISNSKFANQSGQVSGFISLKAKSLLRVLNSEFTHGRAHLQAGAIYSQFSQVVVFNSEFSNLIGTRGVIGCALDSNISITDSLIKDSQSFSGVLLSEGGNQELLRTTIRNSTSSALVLNEAKRSSIKNSSIEFCTGTKGGALVSFDSEFVEILESKFLNNTADTFGGAAFFKKVSSQSTYEIVDTEFLGNSADSGGAIYSEDVSMSVSKTKFTHNSAQTQGGAMSINCPLLKCNITLKDSYFGFNTAVLDGGSIKWNHLAPNTSNLTFLNNSAEYGENVASYATSLVLLTEPNRQYRNSSVVGELTNFPPGQAVPEPIKFALSDEYGNRVLTDNSTEARIKSNSEEVVVYGNTTAVSQKGLIEFDSFIVSAKPGSNFTLEIETLGSFFLFEVSMRNCQNGEMESRNNCIKCPQGEYSFSPQVPCKPCPLEGVCLGNWTMFPKEGYWRPDPLSDKFYKCPSKHACKGSPDYSNYLGNCSTGYTGNMCHACASGYYKTFGGECQVCLSSELNTSRIVLLMVLTIGFCVVTVMTTLRSAYKVKSLKSIYIKIFINYIQLVYLTTQFNLAWPDFLLGLFQVQESTANASEQMFSLDCFLEENSYEKSYFYKTVIMALLPGVAWALSGLVWGAIAYFKSKKSYLQKELVATMIVLFFLVHPTLVKVMFSVFACREIEGQGYWLVENLDIQCWDNTHTFYALAVALPSILVWGVGTPCGVLFAIWKRRRYLHTVDNKLRFGFLFNGYKTSKFYWEFVVVLRKILVICLAVFFTASVPIQGLLCFSVLLISLFAQYKLKPFTSEHLNFVELQAIGTATITIYCGLYYLTEDLSDLAKALLFVVIVLSNACFMLNWMRHMFKVIFSALAGLIPGYRLYLARKDQFDPEMYNEKKKMKGSYYHGDKKMFTLLKEKEEFVDPLENIEDMLDLYRESFYHFRKEEETKASPPRLEELSPEPFFNQKRTLLK